MIIYENGQLGKVKVEMSYTNTPENGVNYVLGEDLDIKFKLSNISSSTLTNITFSAEEPTGDEFELDSLASDSYEELDSSMVVLEDNVELGYIDYFIDVTYTDSEEEQYNCVIRMYNEIVHPSYTTHTWRTGDVVTAPDFNHIENGIIDNSAGLSELSINKLDVNSNSDYMTVTGTSDDASSPNAWKSVDVLESGEIHTSIFTKLSKMFSNIRYLYSQVLNKLDKSDVVTADNISTVGKALDATANNPNVNGSLANSLDTLGTDYATFKQAVIDGEVGGSTATIVTQAEYDALSEAEKNSDTIYFISDAPFDSPNVVTCTRAEYNAMTDATKMDGRFYYITDDPEVDSTLVVQENVNNTDTVPSSAVLYELSSPLQFNSSDTSDLGKIEAIRTTMMDKGITQFCGYIYGTDSYTACALFNSDYTRGIVLRIAYAGELIYKYRYYNDTWTRDDYAPVGFIHSTVSITTDANGRANLYTKQDSSGQIFTFQNTLSAYALGIQQNLTCRLYTWNSSLYVDIRNIDGTAYASQTLNLHIITTKES